MQGQQKIHNGRRLATDIKTRDIFLCIYFATFTCVRECSMRNHKRWVFHGYLQLLRL